MTGAPTMVAYFLVDAQAVFSGGCCHWHGKVFILFSCLILQMVLRLVILSVPTRVTSILIFSLARIRMVFKHEIDRLIYHVIFRTLFDSESSLVVRARCASLGQVWLSYSVESSRCAKPSYFIPRCFLWVSVSTRVTSSCFLLKDYDLRTSRYPTWRV